MKKKAIKVATASAIAASAFVAAAPAQADAASNVALEVSKAVTQMKKAYHTYSDVTANGEFADITVVYKEYNAAKAAYKNAKAVVKAAGGSTQAAYDAQLDLTYNDYIAKRVVTYIDAYNYATTLDELRAQLEAALEAGDWDGAEELYHAISYELKTRTVILHRVYGVTARELLIDAFKLEAQDLRDSIQNEVSVKIYFEKADALVKEGKLTEAKAAMDKVAGLVAGLDKDTDFGAALLTKVAEVKAAYEAKLSPKVSSVTPVNSRQIVVVFNKEVNSADLSQLDFSLETVGNPTTAVLANDNKTVTLTFGSSIEVTDKAFTVESIQTKADTKVSTERYVSKLTYTDTLAASVSAVDFTYSADGKTASATFTFSEPLQAAGTVSVNGVQTSVTTDLAKGQVTVAGLEVGKSYKVDFVGTKDVKGNLSTPITQNVNVPAQVKDEVKPTASVSISGNQVTLQFSEEVTLGTVKVNGVDYASSFVQDANNKTKYVLDAQKAGILTGVNFVNSTVAVEGFKDKALNAGNKVEASGVLTADRTAPAFVSASASKDNTAILLTFNDAVKEGTLSGSDELVLKVKDGVYQTASTLDLTALNTHYGYDFDANGKVEGSENNIVAIDYALAAKSSYTFEVLGKVAADTYGNPVADKLTFTLNVSEVTPGTYKPVANVKFDTVSPSGNVITVDYSAEMSDSALVASNYTVGGKVLPSNATLKFVNSREVVEITLPESFVEVNGTYEFAVTGVTDKLGNTLVGGKAATFLGLTENIAPVASNVSVVDSKTLTVDFSEALKDSSDKTGIVVKVNGTAVEVSSATVSGGDLTIKTVKDFALTDSISVEFKSANLVDSNNNKLKDGVISK